MTPSGRLFLTQEEIQELTGRKRYSSQSVALKQMGIDHKTRHDGRPIVLLSTLEQSAKAANQDRYDEPDWGALGD